MKIYRTKAQLSRAAIEKLFTSMRHLLNRGFYKPMGVSGATLRKELLTLSPEIYGSIATEKTELAGLLYVMQRLPIGIETCSQISLSSEEGLKNSAFEPIIPAKRRRNCYRIDPNQMTIEITRGRSDIYDILTHLTFLYLEAHKICEKIWITEKLQLSHDWQKLVPLVSKTKPLSTTERETAMAYLSLILGRTYNEVNAFYPMFAEKNDPDRFLKIVVGLGNLAVNDLCDTEPIFITFSPVLRERIGHHIHGEQWAQRIKQLLYDKDLLNKSIHIISANMHSVLNALYARKALDKGHKTLADVELYETLSVDKKMYKTVVAHAQKNGMDFLPDVSGTNIDVQVFELEKIIPNKSKDVLIVMDYAFGEQAYETMDELLKPFDIDTENKVHLNVKSISIMGKAGILSGNKGDIMIPTAHIFEGTADNYPLNNGLSSIDFEDVELGCFEGSMITVLGTSLQNKDILRYFSRSTWGAIGLEMEGAHYQKAIQAASQIRGNISKNVALYYAYYASDNPLESGSTLASGGLGVTGVKPTYTITEKILEKILKL